MADLHKDINIDYSVLTDLHDRKRKLYAEKQSRKFASVNWSNKDDEEYDTQISEINSQIVEAIKNNFSKSSIKSEVESKISELKAQLQRNNPNT